MQVRHDFHDEDACLSWELLVEVSEDDGAFLVEGVSVLACVLWINKLGYQLKQHTIYGWGPAERDLRKRLAPRLEDDSRFLAACQREADELRIVYRTQPQAPPLAQEFVPTGSDATRWVGRGG